MDLNIGCGTDEWGDVRLDLSRIYHNRKVKLNILADAQSLPFRDNVFNKTKALHILEHLPNWKKAIQEWCRVTLRGLEIEVPVDADLLRKYVYIELLKFYNFYEFIILPRRRREHLWQFSPEVVMHELKKHRFKPSVRVRKTSIIPNRFFLAKLAQKLTTDIAYVIVAKKF